MTQLPNDQKHVRENFEVLANWDFQLIILVLGACLFEY